MTIQNILLNSVYNIMSTSSNICVKGGKINYEIVKDLSIEEKLKKIIEYTEQLMEYEDTDNTMFRLKLINLYKDYLYLDDDISYNPIIKEEKTEQNKNLFQMI